MRAHTSLNEDKVTVKKRQLAHIFHYKCTTGQKSTVLLKFQVGWQFGHGTTLSTHVCTYAHGKLVSLTQALALENTGTEGACETITSSDRICHSDLGSLLEGLELGGEHITAVHTTGEHQHIQVILAQDEPTLVFNIKAWITEETSNGHQLLIIDLKHIAAAQTLTDNLLAVEILAKIDVEYLQAVLRDRKSVV